MMMPPTMRSERLRGFANEDRRLPLLEAGNGDVARDELAVLDMALSLLHCLSYSTDELHSQITHYGFFVPTRPVLTTSPGLRPDVACAFTWSCRPTWTKSTDNFPLRITNTAYLPGAYSCSAETGTSTPF